MQSKYVGLSVVYSLSTTVDITFILHKLDLQKSTKKEIKHFKLSLLLYEENWATFQHFFSTYHSQKYFIKMFYCLL